MKEFKDLRGFEKFLGNVVKNYLSHERAMLHVMATYIEEDAKRKFGIYQFGVGPYSAWAPLAESTREDRRRQGFEPDNPLYRTGNLMHSIHHVIQGHEAAVGSDDDIMVYQELGTKVDGKQRIPPRPVLGPAAFESVPILKKIALDAVNSWLFGKPVIKPKTKL